MADIAFRGEIACNPFKDPDMEVRPGGLRWAKQASYVAFWLHTSPAACAGAICDDQQD